MGSAHQPGRLGWRARPVTIQKLHIGRVHSFYLNFSEQHLSTFLKNSVQFNLNLAVHFKKRVHQNVRSERELPLSEFICFVALSNIPRMWTLRVPFLGVYTDTREEILQMSGTFIQPGVSIFNDE